MIEKSETARSARALQLLAQQLSEAERCVTRQLAGLLERDGCTVGQWRALVLLADGAGHTMSELAEFALLPAPSLTRLIDRMVAENLVYRTADPHDRRRVLVHVTPRGKAMHRRLARILAREQDAILADADADELDQLAVLLAKLVDRLRQPPGLD